MEQDNENEQPNLPNAISEKSENITNSEERNVKDQPIEQYPSSSISTKPVFSEKEIKNPENMPGEEMKLSRKSSKTIKSKEDIILDEAIGERKKMSFNALKKWDNNRTQFLNTQRNHLENILIRIDKKVEFSKNSMEKLVKYFKEKSQLENDQIFYMNNKLSKISDAFSETFPHSKGKHLPQPTIYFPGLTKSLSRIDELNIQKINELQKKAEFIDQKLIKESLSKSITEYSKKILQLRERISFIKKKLNKINVEVAEKKHKIFKIVS